MPSTQIYIILQFITTADDQGFYITRDLAEIIEIAWSIVDSTTFENIKSDSILIKPINTPITHVCTSKTTITWDDVKNANSLTDAIEKLDNDIQEYVISKNLKPNFITFNSWDLRMKLPKDSKEKSIKLPHYLEFPRHFDIRREYLRYKDLNELEKSNNSSQSLSPSTSLFLSQIDIPTIVNHLEIDFKSSSLTSSPVEGKEDEEFHI